MDGCRQHLGRFRPIPCRRVGPTAVKPQSHIQRIARLQLQVIRNGPTDCEERVRVIPLVRWAALGAR